MAGGPEVRVPPPRIVAGVWVAGWYLFQWFPFEIDGAGTSWAQGGLGAALVGAGIALIVRSVRTFRQAGTPLRPDRPAATLVVTGSYRVSRNPIYLGFAAVYLGLAALLNNAWQVVLLPVLLLMLTTAVIHREEAYLAATFPEYDEYCRRVRRWL
jgi:protein-S-isoprenylcysteine O-methyltransferase Ste14